MLHQLLAGAWMIALFIGGPIWLITVVVVIGMGLNYGSSGLADALSQWFIWFGLIAPLLALRFLSWALRRTDPKRQ